MNCAICKENKIMQKESIPGFYLCTFGHMICEDCHKQNDGQCAICSDSTIFMEILTGEEGNVETHPTCRLRRIEMPNCLIKWDYDSDDESGSKTKYSDEHSSSSTGLRMTESTLLLKGTQSCPMVSELPSYYMYRVTDTSAIASSQTPGRSQLNELTTASSPKIEERFLGGDDTAPRNQLQNDYCVMYLTQTIAPRFSEMTIGNTNSNIQKSHDSGVENQYARQLVKESEESNKLSPKPPNVHAMPLSKQNDEQKENDHLDKDPRFVISTAYRAAFVPLTKDDDGTDLSPPQFQVVPCFTSRIKELSQLKKRFSNAVPVSTRSLYISRAPLQCPETSCGRPVFISDFCKHMAIDHSKLLVERINPGQCKNFLLDPRTIRSGVSSCQVLYLIRDKIVDLGNDKFKDYLPMLLMSERVSQLHLCNIDERARPKLSKHEESHNEFIVLWLTGIVSEALPLHVNLAVWSRKGPACHKVYSGEMSSLRLPQDAKNIIQNAKGLIIPFEGLQLLTVNGKKMLEIQIEVH